MTLKNTCYDMVKHMLWHVNHMLRHRNMCSYRCHNRCFHVISVITGDLECHQCHNRCFDLGSAMDDRCQNRCFTDVITGVSHMDTVLQILVFDKTVPRNCNPAEMSVLSIWTYRIFKCSARRRKPVSFCLQQHKHILLVELLRFVPSFVSSEWFPAIVWRLEDPWRNSHACGSHVSLNISMS